MKTGPRPKRFWIKERNNPQLGKYYVACGRLSQAAARRKAESCYGDNAMHSYPNEKDYNDAIESLKRSGYQVQ